MELLDLLEWEQGDTSFGVMAFRIALAAVLGGLIGFERERRRRSAGLRTHMLIATAAALLVSVSFEIYDARTPQGGVGVGDPFRAIEGVMGGIAFLGAGAIIRDRGGVRGLTTGTSMWLAGAVGLACAAGFYGLAIYVTALALIVLTALKVLERRVIHKDRESDDA